MPEDLKVILRRSAEQQAAREAAAKAERQKQAIGLLGNLDARRAFIYPACGSDLEPIQRLTHIFEDFVYCDYLARPESWTADYFMDEGRGLRCEGVVDLDPATVAQFSNEEPLPWPVDHQWGPVAPWGRLFTLIRTTGGVERRVRLLYLGMEAVTAYHNLFTINGDNVAAICFERCVGLGAANWTSFPQWDEHLGQLVQQSQPWPTFLFAIDHNRGDWPMTQLWQKFHNWEDCPKAYVLPGHQPQAIQVNRAGINGPRKVILKREAMTPQLVQNAQAVVLTQPLYMQHQRQWPAEGWIMLLMPTGQAGQITERNARFLFLGNKTRPLGRILESIARSCDQHKIQSVSSVGIGYEDEGPELDRWRRQAGMPLELTIYCEDEGDVASFGPYADKIQ